MNVSPPDGSSTSDQTLDVAMDVETPRRSARLRKLGAGADVGAHSTEPKRAKTGGTSSTEQPTESPEITRYYDEELEKLFPRCSRQTKMMLSFFDWTVEEGDEGEPSSLVKMFNVNVTRRVALSDKNEEAGEEVRNQSPTTQQPSSSGSSSSSSLSNNRASDPAASADITTSRRSVGKRSQHSTRADKRQSPTSDESSDDSSDSSSSDTSDSDSDAEDLTAELSGNDSSQQSAEVNRRSNGNAKRRSAPSTSTPVTSRTPKKNKKRQRKRLPILPGYTFHSGYDEENLRSQPIRTPDLPNYRGMDEGEDEEDDNDKTYRSEKDKRLEASQRRTWRRMIKEKQEAEKTANRERRQREREMESFMKEQKRIERENRRNNGTSDEARRTSLEYREDQRSEERVRKQREKYFEKERKKRDKKQMKIQRTRLHSLRKLVKAQRKTSKIKKEEEDFTKPWPRIPRKLHFVRGNRSKSLPRNYHSNITAASGTLNSAYYEKLNQSIKLMSQDVRGLLDYELRMTSIDEESIKLWRVLKDPYFEIRKKRCEYLISECIIRGTTNEDTGLQISADEIHGALPDPWCTGFQANTLHLEHVVELDEGDNIFADVKRFIEKYERPTWRNQNHTVFEKLTEENVKSRFVGLENLVQKCQFLINLKKIKCKDKKLTRAPELFLAMLRVLDPFFRHAGITTKLDQYRLIRDAIFWLPIHIADLTSYLHGPEDYLTDLARQIIHVILAEWVPTFGTIPKEELCALRRLEQCSIRLDTELKPMKDVLPYWRTKGDCGEKDDDVVVARKRRNSFSEFTEDVPIKEEVVEPVRRVPYVRTDSGYRTDFF